MAPDELDLRLIKAFRLVARHGSLRQAALRLHQTIPAISGKLRRLEEDLGVTLFERAPNRLVLTEAGRRFLNEADAVVARVERAVASLREPVEPVGRLAVSIGSDQSWFFAPRISAFLKRFPGVELTLSVLQASDSLHRLRHGEIDLAIGVFPPLPAEFDQLMVVETSLSLLCPKGHPLLRQASPPTLDEIAQHRLIVLPKHAETRKLVDRAMSLANATGLNTIEVANCHTASTFVELDVGAALVHSICCSTPQGATRRIDLGQQLGKVAFSLVSRAGERDTAPLATLVERLAA